MKTSLCWIRVLYVVAAVYDGALGVVFLVGWRVVFERFEVTPPNHSGYIVFPALLLIVFALMFAAVAARPVANRNLIPYGILLKLSYSGTVFGYWMMDGIPGMWKPFAFADLVFMVLFAGSWVALKKHAAGQLAPGIQGSSPPRSERGVRG